MSIPNASLSSSSSEALWSLKHDLPEEGQLWVAGENATEAPAPTNSTGFIKTPKQQFSADGKSALADEFLVPPQEHTSVGPSEQSTNQLPDVNGNGDDERINNVGSSSTTRGLTEEKRVKQLRLLEALTVPETTTIYEARCLMAANRADVLVVTDSNGLLTGIFTNKDGRWSKKNSIWLKICNPNPIRDITTKVITPEVDMLTTRVSKVMTKNPIFVVSDTLVVEALQKMVQGKVRQLPVIKNGKVIGLVCLSLCLFDDEMANTETSTDTYDDLTEAAEQRVAERGITVKELPLAFATTLPDTTTIYEVWCKMAATIIKAVILTGSNELFSGILTKRDIISRVIPYGIDVVNTPVSKVMRKKPIFVSFKNLPMEAQQKIVKGELAQLLVRLENVEYGPFVFQLLSLHRGAENHKVIDAPKRTWSKRVNPLDGTHGPGLRRFVHVTNSLYPTAIDDLAAQLPQLRVDQVSGVNACDETIIAPSLSGFVRVNNSSLSNVVNNLVSPPPQLRAVRSPSNLVSGVNTCDEAIPPSLSGFVRVNNYSHSDNPSDNSLPTANGNGDDQTINGSSTNIWGLTEEKRVKQLRLSEALTVPETTSIYEGCCQMAAQRADVLLLTDHSSELLTGILTNKDIIERVVAGETDLVNTPVSKVMTKNPICVLSDALTEDALKHMVDKENFAQFPVIENGKVIGLLDPLENDATAGAYINVGTASSRFLNRGLTVKQLPLKHALIVPETTTIYETCWQMAAGRVEAVVLTDSNALMMGILTKTDIITRINSGIDFVNTPVSKVMTEGTFFVPSDTLPMEIWQEIVRELNLDLLVIEEGEDKDLLYMPLYKYVETLVYK